MSAKSMGGALRSWPSPLRGLRSRRPPSARSPRSPRSPRSRRGTFAAWLGCAIRIRCGGAHVGQCFCGCCVGIAVQRRIAAVFGVAAATAVAAFTRLTVAVFAFGAAVAIAGARPSVPRSLRRPRPSLVLPAASRLPSRAGSRAPSRAIPSAASATSFTALGHHGGHRRAHCLQPGCWRRSCHGAGAGAAPKPNRLFEPGKEALSCGTGAGAGAGAGLQQRHCGHPGCCRCGGGGLRLQGGARPRGGASGSTPLMTGVCLLVGSCERRVTAVGLPTLRPACSWLDVVQTRVVVLQALQLVVGVSSVLLGTIRVTLTRC